MKRGFLSVSLLAAFFIFLKTVPPQGDAKPFASLTDTTNEEKLIYPDLVNKFYLLKGDSLFWFSTANRRVELRQQLISISDTSQYWGLIARKYHYPSLQSAQVDSTTDSTAIHTADRLYTDAAIAIMKDIYQGYKMNPWIGYDQLTEKYAAADNEYLLSCLLKVQTAGELQQCIDALEPLHPGYIALKQELRLQKQKNATSAVASLVVSMNYLRWIHHFGFEQFIVVNLPAARLQYYENDKLILEMRTVVGKPSTPTPRFATYCDQAIMYPYWYVPPSITFNEYLPKIKANPSWLDAQNMQVINGAGKVVDHHALNWNSFHAGNFPYSIRQSTGCDNALGVIKFVISTPYGVYMHDTNNKTAFLSASRFYSHGCIRLEEPIDLGNKLLPGKLDADFLQSCFKEQKPIPVKLKKPVPVFAVYMPVTADEKGKLSYYKDVYKLIK